MPESVFVRDLGVAPYADSFEAMRQFTVDRDESTPDELWLLEHEPVYTKGQALRGVPVQINSAVPVVQSDRGGQITYHGPGQVVVYVLIDIRRAGLNVRSLVRLLEQAIIETLAQFKVRGTTHPDAPGVYVDGAKIASLGLRVRKGFSYHGLALNVAMDLTPFDRIDPCGMAGLSVTQLADLTPEATPADAGLLLTSILSGLLKRPQMRSAQGKQ